MSSRFLAISILAIGVALAGCSGGAPASPNQDGGTPSPIPPTGDAPHQVPDLEALLPSEVLGIAVRKGSISGEEAIEELNVPDPAIDAIMLSGRSPSDIEVAVGAAEDASFVITAIRVPGMDAQTMRAAIVAANDPDVLPVKEGQIAGKNVSSLGDSQFYYANRDVLFSVFAEVNEANEIIFRLP